MLGDQHPHVLSVKYNLAWVYAIQDRLKEAIQPHKETLPQRIAVLGIDHPDTQQSIYNLAATKLWKAKHVELAASQQDCDTSKQLWILQCAALLQYSLRWTTVLTTWP